MKNTQKEAWDVEWDKVDDAKADYVIEQGNQLLQNLAEDMTDMHKKTTTLLALMISATSLLMTLQSWLPYKFVVIMVVGFVFAMILFLLAIRTVGLSGGVRPSRLLHGHIYTRDMLYFKQCIIIGIEASISNDAKKLAQKSKLFNFGLYIAVATVVIAALSYMFFR
ncbi:hypothetical protein [Cysteiniphilum halobium]|uniref:hypothetical protein n=1 Tax=Cysteiniphilum halobium TaxID=2219059 RepID=UPI003F834B49